MKILLINPSWDENLISKKGGKFNRPWPPLDLLNCGALLEKAGMQIEVIDARATPIPLPEIVRKAAEADKVFLTSSPLDRWQCPNIEIERFFKIVEPFQKNNLYIMGVHGDRYPEIVLKRTGALCVALGEPEMTVLELAKTEDFKTVPGIAYLQNGQLVKTENRPLIKMEELPIPAYHLINMDHYNYELMGNRFALLETTRGCPFNCMYCYLEMYGGRGYRRKTFEQMTAELDYIINTVKAESLYFIDLEFTLGESNHVHKLCDYMIEKKYNLPWCCQTRANTINPELLKKMRQAGCQLIHFGVETGSEKIMPTIDKKITLAEIETGIAMTKKAGIEVACFFIFGFPGETREDMEATIQFAKKINPTYASFHIASPFPGTPLYEMSETKELFPETYLKEHTVEKLEKQVKRAFRKFYIRPAYAIARLMEGNPAIWKKQLRLFWAFTR